MEKNKSIKLALTAGIVLVLIGNVLVLFRNHNIDWQNYQKMYLAQAAENTNDLRLKEAFKARTPRIEQVVVTGFGKKRIDRCTTCHAGFADIKFKDSPQPLRTHPPIPGDHPFKTFGCTICHDGNGRGLTVGDAHGKSKDWMEPLLKSPYIEANCVKCHPYPYLKDMPMMASGRKLFMEKGCYSCHKVEGLSKGSLGIDLTYTGSKWPILYFEEKIKNPRSIATPESIMPIIKMPKREITALTVFLKSLKGENYSRSYVDYYVDVVKWKQWEMKEDVAVSAASGLEVISKKNCLSCHTINGSGGKIGPDLSTVGLRRTKEWMIQHFIDPRSLVGGSIMPNFSYSKSELESLALYLGSLKQQKADNAKIYAAEEKQ